MSTLKKVNYYFIKLISSCYYPDDKFDVLFDCIKIRRALKTIIESNNEYLLTDSLIWYIANPDHDEQIYSRLKKLTDYDSMLLFIQNYIEDICCDNYYYNHIYCNLLNEYEQSLFDHFQKTVNAVYRSDKYGDTEDLLNDIFRFIASYVLVNKESNHDYDSYIKPYFTDTIGRIDELLLQGVCEMVSDEYTQTDEYFWEDDELLKFVIGRLGNNVQKVIR